MVNPVQMPRKVYERREFLPRPYQPGETYYSVVLRKDQYIRFNQTPPYIPSRVFTDIAELISGFGDAGTWAVSPNGSFAANTAYNKARAKFVEQLGEASQFGSTLTSERKQTWDTISGGVTNLYLAARAVKRGQLVKAAKILGVAPPKESVRVVTSRKYSRKSGKWRKKVVKRQTLTLPTGREVAHSVANKWLWYSYGIKPLVSDVHNAFQVLVRDSPWKTVKGSSGASQTTDVYANGKTTYSFVSLVTVKAEVRVKNPNLWLANQLGLINPVQMFNEGIPFSFVIDWFSNLSQYIQQWTDFAGLEIAYPVTISKHTVLQSFEHATHPGYNFSKRRTFHIRELSIPSVKLQFAYERFSWQRGANAISLLVGFLGKR